MSKNSSVVLFLIAITFIAIGGLFPQFKTILRPEYQDKGDVLFIFIGCLLATIAATKWKFKPNKKDQDVTK